MFPDERTDFIQCIDTIHLCHVHTHRNKDRFFDHLSEYFLGGGLFLVLTEAMVRRTGSRPLLTYLHRHTRFFLLLTMVFGGLSGVGIWL